MVTTMIRWATWTATMSNQELIDLLSTLAPEAKVESYSKYGSAQEVTGIVYDSRTGTIRVEAD